MSYRLSPEWASMSVDERCSALDLQWTNLSRAEQLSILTTEERDEILRGFTSQELYALPYDWRGFHARPKQIAPDGDWSIWLLISGRGFGKTRTGAGWLHERAEEQPGRWMALIGKNPKDIRDFMIEGPGGILRNIPLWCKEAPGGPWPKYEPSKLRITWPNEAWATLYSSEEPDSLRGFSGDTAWPDELAKWANPREVWDNLQFGMREASIDRPRILITTTPRPIPLIIDLVEKHELDMQTQGWSRIVITRGSSYENRSNLAPEWFAETLAAYEGTRLGRQEIWGEILDDVEGRVYHAFSKKPFPEGNVDAEVEDIGGEILIGQDFNVNPMAGVIGCRVGDELHIFDELELMSSGTEEVAHEYRQRFPDRKIIVYPDPSGRRRVSSAPVGQTDFTILRRAGFEVRSPLRAPLVRDRENNANAMYCSGVGDKQRRRVRIHPRCKALIKALSNLTYKEDSNGRTTSQRDKGSGFDHICDAIDYLMWHEFRVIPKSDEKARVAAWSV